MKCTLQICILLGICILVVYLVQHSYEKITSYVREATKTNNEVLKSGRKDPRFDVDQSSTIDARHKGEEYE